MVTSVCAAPFILEVGGEIDASNADQLRERVENLVSAGYSVVLDGSGTEFFAVAGLRALADIDAICRRGRTSWTLITSDAIDRVLRLAGHTDRYPLLR